MQTAPSRRQSNWIGTALGACLTTSVCLAGPGDLDTTFGVGGLVSTAFPAFYQTHPAEDIAIQSDGKIVVVGDVYTFGAPSDFAVVRYNPDGSLDSSFGTGGLATTDFSNGLANEEARAVAIQADGKIVVAGTQYVVYGDWDFAVARYNVDGSVDTDFGTAGFVATDVGGANGEAAYGVAVQADGKIVLVGYRGQSAAPRRTAVVRYNNDGSLDTGFGSSGVVIGDFGLDTDQGHAMAIQAADAKLVVVGAAGISGDPPVFYVALARYNADGVLDDTFGTGGIITGTIYGLGHDVVIQPDGKILVAGRTRTPLDPWVEDFLVARYNTDGSPDTAFGVGGVVTTDFNDSMGDPYSREAAYGVVLQSDGKIVAGGYSATVYPGEDYDFACARYNPDGTPDTSFGRSGLTTSGLGGNGDGYALALAMQTDGKIVLAGFLNDGLGAFPLAMGLARIEVGTPSIEIVPPGTGSGTEVYSNTDTTFRGGLIVQSVTPDQAWPGVQFADDLHMIRGGDLRSFEFSYSGCWRTSPRSGLVRFYANDPNDGFHQPDEVATLPLSTLVASIIIPALPPTGEPDDWECDIVSTVCVELLTPIALPKDVWMCVAVGTDSAARFPISRGIEVGASHELVYFDRPVAALGWWTYGGANFHDFGSLNYNFVVRMDPDASDTPQGNNVWVEPEPGVALTFNNVTQAGATTVTTSTTNPGPDITSFEFLGVFYVIETNAHFSGQVEVCLDYDDSGLSIAQENALQLMHWDGVNWTDITSSRDTVNNVVCGDTNSFSAFAIGHPVPHPAQDLIDALIGTVTMLNINQGIANSLDAKLDTVTQALDDFNENNNAAAVGAMNAFINAVEAQRGNQIPAEDADELIGLAEAILSLL